MGCNEFATVLRINSLTHRQTFAPHGKVLACIANGRKQFAKVLNMEYFFVRQKSSQNNRQIIACVANPSPTLHKRSQTHRNLVYAICTCDKYAIQMRIDWYINKTISRLNCEKIKVIEIGTNVMRHSRQCLTTVVRCTHSRETLTRTLHDCCEVHARMSLDCRETLARMSHDCRASVFNINACLS